MNNNNFKQITYKKIQWLGNSTKCGGAQNEVIKNKTPDDLIIHLNNSKLHRLWASTTPDKLLELIKKNIGLFEVIQSYPHKNILISIKME